jgi:hypothetical protein
MNVAILGVRGTNMSNEERDRATQKIIEISKSYENLKILTMKNPNGGVNTIVELYANVNDIPIEIIEYGGNMDTWRKNCMRVADKCDSLHCITTTPKSKKSCHHCLDYTHENTGACNVMKWAKSFGKRTKLSII